MKGNYAFTGREGVVDGDAEPGHYTRTMNKNWGYSSELVGSSNNNTLVSSSTSIMKE